MLDSAQVKIVSGTWPQLKTDAQHIREQVFICEQNIAAADEWDDKDAVSVHFIVYVNAQPVATARLLPQHSIGRVAVLKEFRGLGLGQQLMFNVMAYAQSQQRPFVKLSSQVHALRFYTALGFKAEGEVYLDCGIPHQDMRYHFE